MHRDMCLDMCIGMCADVCIEDIDVCVRVCVHTVYRRRMDEHVCSQEATRGIQP